MDHSLRILAPIGVSTKAGDFQVDLASAALTCGVTNVVTLSFIGIGPAPGLMTEAGNDPSWSLHDIGHGKGGSEANERIITWHSAQLLRLLNQLDSVTEGDHTILDNTVVLFASDNAESHHSRTFRWPLMLVGGGGGRLNTGGRYIRYPSLDKQAPVGEGPAGLRALADLMSSLGHVLNHPIDDFGKAGKEVVKGPLSEILV